MAHSGQSAHSTRAAPAKSMETIPGERKRVRVPGLSGRTVLVVVLSGALFAPLVALEVLLDRPFVASTFAGIAAIAFHDAGRYRRERRRILLFFTVTFALAISLSLSAAAVSLPPVIPATATAVSVLASRAGRAYPPLACVSFAVVADGSVLSTAVDWAVVAAAAGYLLTALIPLTGLVTQSRTDARSGKNFDGNTSNASVHADAGG